MRHIPYQASYVTNALIVSFWGIDSCLARRELGILYRCIDMQSFNKHCPVAGLSGDKNSRHDRTVSSTSCGCVLCAPQWVGLTQRGATCLENTKVRAEVPNSKMNLHPGLTTPESNGCSGQEMKRPRVLFGPPPGLKSTPLPEHLFYTGRLAWDYLCQIRWAFLTQKELDATLNALFSSITSDERKERAGCSHLPYRLRLDKHLEIARLSHEDYVLIQTFANLNVHYRSTLNGCNGEWTNKDDMSWVKTVLARPSEVCTEVTRTYNPLPKDFVACVSDSECDEYGQLPLSHDFWSDADSVGWNDSLGDTEIVDEFLGKRSRNQEDDEELEAVFEDYEQHEHGTCSICDCDYPYCRCTTLSG